MKVYDCLTSQNIRKKMICLIGIGSLLIAMVVVLFYSALSKRFQEEAFSVPKFHENASNIEDDFVELETYGILMVQEGYQIGICGQPNYQDGKIAVGFTNCTENSVWMQLCILNKKRELLYQTGLIRPGEWIKEIDVGDSVKNNQEVILQICGYEPESYYSVGEVCLETILKEKKNKK